MLASVRQKLRYVCFQMYVLYFQRNPILGIDKGCHSRSISAGWQRELQTGNSFDDDVSVGNNVSHR